jgi:hypothetical protein
MDVHEHRLLTALLRRERLGLRTLHVPFLIELEGYIGQIIDLQARGIITPDELTPHGTVVGLTPLGRELAESLPEKWGSAD